MKEKRKEIFVAINRLHCTDWIRSNEQIFGLKKNEIDFDWNGMGRQLERVSSVLSLYHIYLGAWSKHKLREYVGRNGLSVEQKKNS